MQQLLSLLPALACPLGMGLMMFLFMRGTEQGKQDARQLTEGSTTPQPATATDTMASCHTQPQKKQSGLAKFAGAIACCLNWKVVAGVVVAGVGLWVLAPNLVWAILPTLVLLICPLSMVIMIVGMARGKGERADANQAPEIQSPLHVERTETEQLAELHVRRETITREIAELEAAHGAATDESQAPAAAERQPVQSRR